MLSEYPFREAAEKVYGNKIFRFKDIVLVTIEEELVKADFLEEKLDFKTFIFASRHESAAKLPSLLTHVPGNFTEEVKLGGRPRKLTIAPPAAMFLALKKMVEQREKMNLIDWEVSYEATHHGPYLEKTAALFVEIGSGLEEWTNEKAGVAVASAIMEAAFAEEEGDVCIAFGGPHYAPKITKVSLEKGILVGHIAPKYVLDYVDEDMVAQMVERTRGSVRYALLDWKGMKRFHRESILPILNALRLEILRI